MKTEILVECVDIFKKCTENKDNHFTAWKFWVKTLSMAAGELNFNDLPFDDNPIYLITFALFIILVLFVIMNLMTSVAVNDIQEIRNRSRDAGWHKLMLTLQWYDAAFALCPIKVCKDTVSAQNPDHMVHQQGRTYMEELTSDRTRNLWLLLISVILFVLIRAVMNMAKL